MRRLIGAAVLPLLLAGCANVTPTATALPPPTRTIEPTRTAIPSSTPNLTPSATSALAASTANASSLDATLRATFSPSPPAPLAGEPPPFAITLPTGWRSTYTTAPLQDQFSQTIMNVAAYAGPVADKGTGFIFVLWNFPSVMPIAPGATPITAAELQKQMAISDGFRLLRGTVIDISCTVGNYGQVDFKIGGQSAAGQRFQASGCQDNSPDIVGWYAGLRQNNRNLLFYAYVEPVSAYNNGQRDVQAVLDNIDFSAANLATPNATQISTAPATTPISTLTVTTTPELN